MNDKAKITPTPEQATLLITLLNFGDRPAYKLAGAFNKVRRAHRSVYYQ